MRKVTDNIHKVMRHDPLTNEISGSIDLSIENIDKRLKDFQAQLDVNTATWGLEVYEREHGIITERSKPIEDRRSVVKSKMRGSGKLTATQIKIVADSFTNGNVAVSFDHRIIIEFTSVVGIPPNMDDLKQALEYVKPAHLPITYTFRYMQIKEIHNVLTLKQMEQIPLSKFGGATIGQ